MNRTNIYLSKKSLEHLRKIAAEKEVSVAELVRGAIDYYLKKTIRDQKGQKDAKSD